MTRPQHDPSAVAVQSAFDELGRLSFADHSLGSVLHTVTRLAGRVLPGEPVTSVTILRERGPATVAASGPVAVDLDRTQYRLGDGPCLTAARTGKPAEIPDTRAVTTRAELAAEAAESTRKARKAAKTARKMAVAKRSEVERKAAATAAQVRRRNPVAPEPRRWPWLLLALAVGAGVFALLRRSRNDDWTPAPAGDGPVPSYREDPVPTSSDNSGKTVSSAMNESGDSAPPESDMGIRDAQFVDGDGPDGETKPEQTAPEPFTSGGGADEGPTAGPAAGQA